MISRVIAALALAATALSAQAPSQTPGTGKVFLDYQVEKTVVPSSKNQAPKYPKDLRAASIEGQVDAEFVVGADGRVMKDSFKALKSSHDLFTKSVIDVLPSLRFTPAMIGKEKVAQRVRMPFVFSLASDTSAVLQTR